MTPNHDHASLFLAPAARRDVANTPRTRPAPDHRTEAMRVLCHPFAVSAGLAADADR